MSSILINNATELMAALQTLKGGETLVLKEGDYGNLNLSAKNKIPTNLPSEVKIVSADPDHPATFNSIAFNSVKNFTFDSVKVDCKTGETTQYAVNVNSSSNIVFKNSEVMSNGTPDHPININGFFVRGSTNVQLENNDIHNVGWGSAVASSTNVVVKGNSYHDNLGDNSRYAADIHNILVEGNTFYPPAANNPLNTHQDQIQFWTTQATQHSTDITIRGNYIYNYGDAGVQSIFMRGTYNNSSDGTWNEFRYKNVTIEDNVVVGNHAHGIMLSAVDGALIQNNTVLYSGYEANPAPVNVPKITVASATGVQVLNNVTNDLSLEAGVVSSGNVMVDRYHPSSPNYIGNLFLNGANQFPNAGDLIAQPGGLLDKGNGQIIGARLDTAVDQLTARGDDSYKLENGHYVYTLDASATQTAAGKTLDGAIYQWKLADGTILEGKTVKLVFDETGKQDVTLIVKDKYGTIDSTEHTIVVRDTHALHLDFNEKTIADKAGYESIINFTAPVYVAGENNAGTALQMNAGTDRIHLGTIDPDLFGIGEITVTGTMRFDAGAHKLFHVHGLGTMSTNQVGFGGKFVGIKAHTAFTDGKFHDIAYTISKTALTLYVDGVLHQTITTPEVVNAMVAALQNPGGYGITLFGTPWAGEMKGAIDSLDVFTVALTAEQIAKLHSGALSADNVLPPVETNVNLLNPNAPEPIPIPVPTPTPEPTPTPTPDPDPIVTTPPIAGTGFADALAGTAGDDTMFAGAGDDTITSGNGNNLVQGDAGADLVFAGTGADMIYGDGVGNAAGDGNDTLIGYAGNDTFIGGGGNDFFCFVGGDGADRINDFQGAGGAGGDLIRFLAASGVNNFESLNITNSNGNSVIDLGGGNSITVAGVTNLTAGDFYFDNYKAYVAPPPPPPPPPIGNVVNGTSTADNLKGTSANESIYGAAGDDTIDSGAGANLIRGDAGNDLIFAGAGVDTIEGGDGNDTMIGYAGNDILTGGAGNDYFCMSSGLGRDRITDFQGANADGGDFLRFFANTGVTNFAQLSTRMSVSDGNTIIDLGGGNSVTVVGVTKLAAGDFYFG